MVWHCNVGYYSVHADGLSYRPCPSYVLAKCGQGEVKQKCGSRLNVWLSKPTGQADPRGEKTCWGIRLVQPALSRAGAMVQWNSQQHLWSRGYTWFLGLWYNIKQGSVWWEVMSTGNRLRYIDLYYIYIFFNSWHEMTYLQTCLYVEDSMFTIYVPIFRVA